MSEPNHQQPDDRTVVPSVTTDTDKMRLDAALAEIERLKAPQKWVKCSERMPTEKDADCDDYVWWKWPDRMNPLRRRWDSKFSCAVYWQPTGLKRPEPPKEEA